MNKTATFHRIPCLIGDRKPLFQHLIDGDLWLWLDTGIATTPHKYLLPYLDAMGLHSPGPQYTVITHADVDHFGGVAAMRESFPDLVVSAHHADATWIRDRTLLLTERYRLHANEGIGPTPTRLAELQTRGGPPASVDIELTGGETIDTGVGGRWQVLHAPGHSPGHLILWNAADSRMVIGDAILAWGVLDIDGAVVAPPPYYDVPQYLDTISLVESLAPYELCTSHFPLMRGLQVQNFLEQSRSAVDVIGEAVAGAIRRRGQTTLVELCETVGASVDRWPPDSWPGLADPISAHLNQLELSGEIVTARRSDGPARVFAK